MDKRKKLLLINPKNQSLYYGYNFIPPIAFGIIWALTPDYWIVDIVDENFQDIGDIAFEEYNLAGITTNTLNINRVYELASVFRQNHVAVVLGGAHATSVPDEAQKFADAVVIGDVENVWAQLISDFENGNLKKSYYSNELPKFVLPKTDFYKNNYTIHGIETSRGCKNNCAFCGIHIPEHKTYIRKPLEMVIEELAMFKSPFLTFVDNNFYGNDDEYLTNLFEEMIRKRIKKTWQTGVSVNFFKNRDLVKLAAKAGAKMFFVGFESDTKQSLTELNKNNFRAAPDIFYEYREIIKTCHKNNILVSGNYMIGIENDTEQSIAERTRFFKNLKLDECACVILTPLPNTPVFKKYLNENRLIYTNFPKAWEKYHYGKSLVTHQNITGERLEELAISNNMLFRQSFWKMVKTIFTSMSFRGFIFTYLYCKSFEKYSNPIFDKLLKMMSKPE